VPQEGILPDLQDLFCYVLLVEDIFIGEHRFQLRFSYELGKSEEFFEFLKSILEHLSLARAFIRTAFQTT
jgi:hypothetical protein